MFKTSSVAAVRSADVARFASLALGRGEGPLFELGRVEVTEAAARILFAARASVGAVLVRHVCGDWSDMTPAAARLNNDRIDDEGGAIFGTFAVRGLRLVVATRADRSETTVMAPEEFGEAFYEY